MVFDRVFVPDELVLGEIGAGWQQVTSELAFERSGPERFLSTFPLLAAMVGELAGDGASGPVERELGGLVTRLWALRRMSLAVAGALASGAAPELAAAVVKDLGTRFENEVVDAARLLVAHPAGPRSPGGFARLLADAVLHAPGFTLRGRDQRGAARHRRPRAGAALMDDDGWVPSCGSWPSRSSRRCPRPGHGARRRAVEDAGGQRAGPADPARVRRAAAGAR